ncbi:hypothetical protein F511_11912 [Dorcoceras hygrometricum]|uniref:Uncharacterized protein n=1 Tax=Dorcoceras hygrometricum TaxID=472368 RepID=A0A2Z7B4X3_9LAMI|nr:hypothetical protein F511_11912 [Dorcoceras hygrometricum]
MSLFDLQDVCIAIGSIATLDLPMVVDLIEIYGLKGPYRTLTTTNWFLQALSVIPRGSWGDVARRSYHDPMGKSGIVIPEPQWVLKYGFSYHSIQFWKLSRSVRSDRRSELRRSLGDGDELNVHPLDPGPLGRLNSRRPLSSSLAAAAASAASPEFVPAKFDEENPSAPISSGLLVQADEGIPSLVMDLIDDIYRRLSEHCDVLSMQMDSDLVIYRTTLVRTFQVVTICLVDKSEAAGLGEVPMHVGVDASLSRIHRSLSCVDILCLVLTTRNVIETLHDRRLTLTRLPNHLGSLGGRIGLQAPKPPPLLPNLTHGRRPPPRLRRTAAVTSSCDRTCFDHRDEEFPRIYRRLQFKSQISLRILVGARRLDASKVVRLIPVDDHLRLAGTSDVGLETNGEALATGCATSGLSTSVGATSD